ncbi:MULTISPECIES: 5'/3'-nucleotidase SurE [unclassified Butyrivibrio]|uniref:5'/3'-nucleotidase SurE n=1 Tax=unclassified Butyrivibrio TaxID=2639466 RepID=UPI0008EBCC72|nr:MULTISPECIES: 5'/3'-nucleotidase SurE [unclassified Butyrivibrio]RKM63351.1 5'/3'-nucleotidase SurE [Butyrivibrio sp. XB500-5]SFU79022.1 5'-nucleotidase /3'-nucleotidase /exopolyphosphatase [Butyrivibrio sp. INlla21]
MGKKIFITNDDGIESDGIARLAKVAKEFGEVWIVAPESQRSAASHSITLRHPIDVHPFSDFPVEGVHAFSCSGTPGDCVRVGTLNIMPEKPDVVLSGINFGYNVASDIQYSATAGAAFEGEFQGYLSIALSEGITGCHEVTDRYLSEILKELFEKPYVPGQIWNVNFPHCRLDECKGILRDRLVSRKAFYVDRYKAVEEFSNGGVSLMVDGIYSPEHEDLTDFGAVLDNYVSVGVVKNLS